MAIIVKHLFDFILGRFGIQIFSIFLILVKSIPDSNAQLLWKISGEGLKNSSYLFGTIHVVPESLFVVWPAVDSAFRQSQLLIMEMDLDFSAAEMIEAARGMALPKGKTLSDYLPADGFEMIRAYCMDSLQWKKRKFKRYCRMKPFYFSSLVLSDQLGKVSGYEHYFSKQAKRMNKPIRGLETIQQQLYAIDQVSVEEQAAMLGEAIQEGRKEFESMLDLYLKRDLDALWKLMLEEGEAVDGFTSVLLNKRNANWISQLEKWLPEQPLFVAVGAGHLPGEAGLIELLRNKGFSVEAVW
jgi:uncharacterized protein YbaP (TraB family)